MTSNASGIHLESARKPPGNPARTAYHRGAAG
jgi:hypothetical protein